MTHHPPFRSRACTASLLMALAALAAPLPALAASDNEAPAQNARLIELRDQAPGVGFFRTADGRLTSVYGTAFSTGRTAIESAGSFAARFSDIFNVPGADLALGSCMTDSGPTQGVYFDQDTGRYRFTLVYYTQQRAGIPVFRADLRLLTRNENGFPLVLAKSALRDLGDFQVPAGWQAKAISWKTAQDAVRKAAPGMANFAAPRVVIWAGYDDTQSAPRLAYEFIADNNPAPGVRIDRRLFVVDALTGGILFAENQVVDVDVTGTVTAIATDGHSADACGPESSHPMAYARVSIGGTTAYANANGEFIIPNGGSGSVTVNSPMSGRYFVVNDSAGPTDALSLVTTPPGPVNFVHNAANSSEFIRSEVNTYIAANEVRDYTLLYNPTYPTVSTQLDFPINVNLNDTCNAFYDGSSINFYRTGGGCNNTGFGTVVHHEYGHHLVNRAGSGQGAYGEGMGDVMGVLITDNSVLGIGFQGCSGGLRNANNSCEYQVSGCSSCGSAIHACGQLISGCVWSVRSNLLASHPSTYRQVISGLAINSMLLHQGTIINPAITIDYLTLDDDDADLNNGTPHYNQINNGFTAHNMPGPALPAIGFVFPDGRPQTISPAGGTTLTVQVIPVTGVPQSDSGSITLDTGSGFATFSMTQTTPNTYTFAFPPVACGTVVSYYVSARNTSNFTISSPANAPSSLYTATGATGTVAVFSDNIETFQPWTVGLASDTATTGQWVRGDPIGTAAQPEDDHTPAPGTFCFFTGQGTAGGGVGQADIDGGITTLISPTFDLSGLTSPRVSYWRWYSNNQGAAPGADTFDISISNNNGATWSTAEIVGPSGPETVGGWFFHEIDVASILTPTNQMKVRFVASDLGSGSIVEAAIDDFDVYGFTCAAACPADWNNDGAVSSQDFFDFLSAFFANNADFNSDGTTNSQDFFDFLGAFFQPC